jgi:predicted  nucleic acid-binding Zn-ribbon protein
MKRCPKCSRQYDDETLRFCLEDGSPLFSEHDSKAPATEIMPPRGGVTLKSSGPTVPSYLSGGAAGVEERVVRQTNPLLTAGVIAIAVLLLALVGIAGFFVLKPPAGNESAQANRGRGTAAEDSSPSPTRTTERSPTPDEITSNDSQRSGPLKITASASSVRLALQANTYYASNSIDAKRATAWIEGVDGPGLGEWIRFDFDREINLHRILIQPGYFKSPQIWAENNRLASVTAQFSDGSSRELNFADLMETQKIEVGSIKTRWVRLVIKSVYHGTNPGPSDDTALSEIAFEWD